MPKTTRTAENLEEKRTQTSRSLDKLDKIITQSEKEGLSNKLHEAKTPEDVQAVDKTVQDLVTINAIISSIARLHTQKKWGLAVCSDKVSDAATEIKQAFLGLSLEEKIELSHLEPEEFERRATTPSDGSNIGNLFGKIAQAQKMVDDQRATRESAAFKEQLHEIKDTSGKDEGNTFDLK